MRDLVAVIVRIAVTAVVIAVAAPMIHAYGGQRALLAAGAAAAVIGIALILTGRLVR